MSAQQASMAQLLKDRQESEYDLRICEQALASGVILYGTGQSVIDRIIGNNKVIEVIDEELKRRSASN